MFQVDKVPLQSIPIIIVQQEVQYGVIKLVDKILAAPDSHNVPDLEAEIDQMVYKLYGLTEDEIKIVEGEK